jgi:urea transporter
MLYFLVTLFTLAAEAARWLVVRNQAGSGQTAAAHTEAMAADYIALELAVALGYNLAAVVAAVVELVAAVAAVALALAVRILRLAERQESQSTDLNH